MMGGSVFAHQSGTVETEDHMQIEQGHIVDDIVEGALGKGAVDIAERQQSVFCHTPRESHRMSFSDAHIEGALRHLLHHDIHRTAAGHGWCHTNNLRILLGQFQKRMAKHVLVFLGFVGVLIHDSLARLRIEFAWGVPGGHIFLSGSIAVSFLRMQM